MIDTYMHISVVDYYCTCERALEMRLPVDYVMLDRMGWLRYAPCGLDGGSSRRVPRRIVACDLAAGGKGLLGRSAVRSAILLLYGYSTPYCT